MESFGKTLNGNSTSLSGR